jgi:hypothetical protein
MILINKVDKITVGRHRRSWENNIKMGKRNAVRCGLDVCGSG